MKKSENTAVGKLERKTIERNRRIHMKNLCFKLTSLIPPHHFKPSTDLLTQQGQIDQAAIYLKRLRERIEELKCKKEQAMGIIGNNKSGRANMKIGFGLPVINLREFGSSIEVSLISGLKKKFKLCEVISVLEEEGAEVVNASFATVGDKVFHTLHAQVKISGVGVDTSRVYQSLQELIC